MGNGILNSYKLVAISGWLSKAVSSIAQLLLIKLIVKFVGISDYAVYVVIMAFSGWAMLFEYGVGIAAQNHISGKRATGRPYDVDVKKINGIVYLIFFANLIVFPILSAVLYFYLGHVENDVPAHRLATVLVAVMMMLQISTFSVVYRIFYAEHRGYFSNILPATATLFSLLSMYVISQFNVSADYRLLISVSVTFLPILIAEVFAHFARFNLEFEIDWRFIINISKSSRKFFTFNFLSLTTLGVDVIIIAYFLEGQDVVVYNILFRIFSLAIFVYSAYLLAIMPVSAEMIREGNYLKLNKIIKTNLFWGGVFCVIAALVVYQLRQDIVYFFSGKDIAVKPEFIVFMGAYVLVRVWTDTFAMLLQSINEMKNFIIFVLAQSVLSVILQIIFVKKFGMDGAPIGLICAYILTVTWLLPLEYKNICLKKWAL